MLIVGQRLRTHRIIAWIIGFLLLVPTTTAWAREKVDKKLAKEAHKHTKQGLRYLKVGKLDAAIEELQIAYGLSKDPDLLFHIAEALNEKHDYEQALYYYKAFRENDPGGAKQHGIDEIIGALEELIPSQPNPARAQSEPAPSEHEAPAPSEHEAPAPQAQRAPAAPTTPPASTPPSVPTPSRAQADTGSVGSGKRIAGLVTGASGLVLVGAGVYFGKIASDRADEVSQAFETHGTWGDASASAYDEGRSAERSAIVLSAVGGAAVVTGAVLYYLGWRDQAQAHAHVEVTVSTSGATVGWTCAF